MTTSSHPASNHRARHKRHLLQAAVLVSVGLAAAHAPALFGRAVLLRVTEEVRAERVSGLLWSPVLHDATVKIPGVTAEAERFGARIVGLDPVSRVVQVNLQLRGGKVSINPEELAQRGENAIKDDATGWKVHVAAVDITETKLELQEQKTALPNARLQARSIDEKTVLIEAETNEGRAEGRLRLPQNVAENDYRLDFLADASILQYYWYGVERGTLRGSYRFGNGAAEGHVEVENAELRPIEGGADLRLTGVGGQIVQRGDEIEVALASKSWSPEGESLRANLRIDTAKERMDGELTGLLAAEKMHLPAAANAKGNLLLDGKIWARGWNNMRFDATAQGTALRLSEVDLQDAHARYSWSSDGPDRLRLRTEARLLDERQHLELAYSPMEGPSSLQLQATGQLQGRPLALRAEGTEGTLRLSGRALGGPIAGDFREKTQAYNLRWSPDLGQRIGLNLQGEGENWQLQARGGGGEAQFWQNAKVGGWRMENFSYGGASLSGGGDFSLHNKRLSGPLRFSHAALNESPSGPLRLDWQNGLWASWHTPKLRLQHEGARTSAVLRGFSVQDWKLNGSASFDAAARQLTGDLSAHGKQGRVSADLLGQHAALSGDLLGQNLSGEMPIFPAAGAKELQLGELRLRQEWRLEGWRGELQSGKALSALSLQHGKFSGRGRVDLAALRPLLAGLLPETPLGPWRSLGGTLELRGSNMQLNGQLQHAALRAGLSQKGEAWRLDFAHLNGKNAMNGLHAKASGALFPTADLRGQLVAERLPNATLSRPARLDFSWHKETLTASGELPELTSGALRVPAQPVSASLHNGAWKAKVGDLWARGAGKHWRLGGEMTAFLDGEGLRLSGTAGSEGADLRLRAARSGEVRLSGPLRRLQLRGQLQRGGDQLGLNGTINAQNGAWTLRPRGRLAGVSLSGALRGVGAAASGQLDAEGPRGGSLRLSGASLWPPSSLRLQASGFQLAKDAVLNGTINLHNQNLSGGLIFNGPAAQLALQASGRRLGLQGRAQSHRLQGNAEVNFSKSKLPALENIALSLGGPQLSGQLTGDIERLSGRLRSAPMAIGDDARRIWLGEGAWNAEILPLKGKISIGDLAYQNGNWRGSLGLSYLTRGAAGGGQIRLLGEEQRLVLALSGAARGRVDILPRPKGQIALPAELLGTANESRPSGQILAELEGMRLRLTSRNLRLNGRRFSLSGEVNGEGGFSVADLRASLALRGEGPTASDLRFSLANGRADLGAGALQVEDLQAFFPALLKGYRGRLQLFEKVSLSEADLAKLQKGDLNALNARLGLQLRGQNGEQLSGELQSKRGQIWGNLQGQISQKNLFLRGKLYPRVEATGQFDGLALRASGHLHGTVQAQLSGTWAGKAAEARLQARHLLHPQRPATAELQGRWNGNSLEARVKSPRAGADILDWRLSGELLHSAKGETLRADLAGRVGDARLQAEGRLQGHDLQAKAHWNGRQLRLLQLQAAANWGQLQASGPLWPRLALQGNATLRGEASGEASIEASGEPSAARVQLKGHLNEGSRLGGVFLGKTDLQATLQGGLWQAALQGEGVTGRLNGDLRQSNAPAGLQALQLQLHSDWQRDEDRLAIVGPLGWNAAAGWSGEVQASGTLRGEALRLRLNGVGPLALTGQGLGGGIRGELAKEIFSRPSGQIELSSLNVGALWKARKALPLSGELRLSGENWKNPRLIAKGTSGGAAAGTWNANWNSEGWRANWNGDAGDVAASGHGNELQASLDIPETFEAAELLPSDAAVSALGLRGRAKLWRKNGENFLSLAALKLQGEHNEWGKFGLFGGLDAHLNKENVPLQLSSNLAAQLQGGRLGLVGDPNSAGGLRLSAHDFSLSPFGLASVLNGDLQAKPPRFGAAETGNAALGGRLDLSGETSGFVALGGTFSRPQLSGTVEHHGEDAEGRVHFGVRDVDLQAKRAAVRLQGGVWRGENRANIDVAGVWPRLSGEAKLRSNLLRSELRLHGKNGEFSSESAGLQATASLHESGSWLPTLQAAGELNLPELFAGAEGEGRLGFSASGPLQAPLAEAELQAPNLRYGGASLADLSGKLRFASGLQGSFQQGGLSVAELRGGRWMLSGLRLGAGGSVAALSGMGEGGRGELHANVEGALRGEADLERSASGATKLQAGLSGGGHDLQLNASAKENGALSGNLQVAPRAGAISPLERPASIRLSGSTSAPVASGRLALLGSSADLQANSNRLSLAFSDDGATKASGTLALDKQNNRWMWSGSAKIEGPRLALELHPSGDLQRGSVGIAARRGSWKASGAIGGAGGRLALHDGAKSGVVELRKGVLQADLQQMNLDGLLWRSLHGELTATGTLSLKAKEANGPERLDLELNRLQLPRQIEPIGLPMNGDIKASLSRPTGAALQISAKGDLGHRGFKPEPQNAAKAHFELFAREEDTGLFASKLNAALQRGEGQLQLSLQNDKGGASGRLLADDLLLGFAGGEATLSGEANISGEQVEGSATLRAGGGGAQLSGFGGWGAVADFFPAVGKLAGLEISNRSHELEGEVSRMPAALFTAMQGVSGEISGRLDLVDGAGQWYVSAPDFALMDEKLPVSFDGLRTEGNWRIRGRAGESTLQAGVQNGRLSGSARLQHLPLGEVANVALGSDLGSAWMSGVGRFELPLADPLAGRVEVASDLLRIDIPASENGPRQQLSGGGGFLWHNRELRNINVKMDGAGSWNVGGHYRRDGVDLQADFSDTTFTPLLALVPSLVGEEARLQGSLNLRLSGDYRAPIGSVQVRDLRGKHGDLLFTMPEGSGVLKDEIWEFDGALGSRGPLVSAGRLRASGALNGSAETTLRYDGALTPDGIGELPKVSATLRESAGSWQLSAISQDNTGGRLGVEGTVAPRIDLQMNAENHDFSSSKVFMRSGELSGRFSLQEDAEKLLWLRGDAALAAAVLGNKNNNATEQAIKQGSAPPNDEKEFISPLPEAYTSFPQSERDDGATTPEAKAQRSMLQRIVLDDVGISFPNGIKLAESLAQAELTGGLRLNGTAAAPRVGGKLNVERGTLLIRDTTFVLQDGGAVWNNDGPHPRFNLRALGQVAQLGGGAAVPVLLEVSGEATEDENGESKLDFTTTLRCEGEGAACRSAATGQPYSEAELYALVIAGVPSIDRLPENIGSLGASALNTALNVLVMGELSRNLADALGVDVLRFTPAVASEGGASFTIGRRLSETLYVEYQIDLRGAGSLDASYSTPDGKFTIRISTPFELGNGLVHSPKVSAGYNINERASVSVEAESTTTTNRFGVGLQYRLPNNFWTEFWKRQGW